VAGSDHEIPWERLPPDFARRLDAPPEPAVPRPAATVVVLREGDGGGSEVLLLRRSRSAGFVPGAYVFPGGRLDPADASPEALDRLLDRNPDAWGARLKTAPEERDAEDPGIPGAAYLTAALRETFEETGLLVARTGAGGLAPSASEDEDVARLRTRLLADEIPFAVVLGTLGLHLDDAAVEYIAHWITPIAEPRRYDTRFFAVRVPREAPVSLQEEEVVAHVWLTPREALDRWREGSLPMIFPTIRTLEDLLGLGGPDEVLAHFRSREIPTILPRLVRTPTGVGIEVPPES
jgi:8-oxo-dGTP pyrophosphatase MutT (NUDIX family)